jgi:SpoU rRNA methylase family enzyme
MPTLDLLTKRNSRRMVFDGLRDAQDVLQTARTFGVGSKVSDNAMKVSPF